MVRIKHRYFLVELSKPIPTLTTTQLLDVIRSSIQLLYGDYGAGALGTNLSIIYLNANTGIAIIKCLFRCWKSVLAAITATSSLPMAGSMGTATANTEQPNRMISNNKLTCLHISGTIKHCQLQAIKHHKQHL